MKIYSLYKTEKFLENSNTFLLVNFLANPQKTLFSFREKLNINKLNLKFIKSKALLPFLSKYLNSKHIQFLYNVSKGPLYLIQNTEKNNDIFDSIANLKLEDFLQKKIYVFLFFFRGKVYTSNLLFSLKKENIYLKFLESFNIRNQNLLFNFKFSEIFLIKILYIHLFLQ